MQKPDFSPNLLSEVLTVTTDEVSFWGYLVSVDASSAYFLVSKVITGVVPGLFVGTGRLFPMLPEKIVSII